MLLRPRLLLLDRSRRVAVGRGQSRVCGTAQGGDRARKKGKLPSCIKHELFLLKFEFFQLREVTT